MSGYADEKNMETNPWQPEVFGEFEFNYDDEVLTNKLAFDRFTSEDEIDSALDRLAIVASKTGSVSARSALAQYGGLDIKDAQTFIGAVNPDLADIDTQIFQSILRKARQEKAVGNKRGYKALSGAIGIYPPEAGDDIKILTPGYDDIVSQMWSAVDINDFAEAEKCAILAGLNPDSLVGDGK